jgi:hypothetical protein
LVAARLDEAGRASRQRMIEFDNVPTKERRRSCSGVKRVA